jgi:hypothetical protein
MTYLPISRSRPKREKDFPRCPAPPTGRTDYKSLSEGHIRAGSRTIGSQFSTHE